MSLWIALIRRSITMEIRKIFLLLQGKHSRHNNRSAIKAHGQFKKICELMSLPSSQIKKIRTASKSAIEKEMQVNRKKAIDKKIELEEIQERLFSVEEKWIKNDINRETYDRWYTRYNKELVDTQSVIERLGRDHGKAFKILENNLGLLTDICILRLIPCKKWLLWTWC